MINKIDISLDSGNEAKEQLSISRQEWGWTLLFLLSMSMVGLSFPLGYVGLIIVLLNRFIKDRYDFVICFTILTGRYALVGDEDLPFKPMDLAFVISVIGFFVYKKSPIVKKIMVAMLLYALVLFMLAKTSDERMSVQFMRMRYYLMIFYVFVPLMAFSGRDFYIKIFFKKLFPYILILSAFYIIDGFILNGYVLIPNSYTWANEKSIFYSLLWNPLSTNFPRKYPQGLFILCMCLFPIMKYYKLSVKQWIVIGLALATTRTMTFIFGIIFAYVVFQGHLKAVMKYLVGALIAVVVLYYIDGAMGGFLRIQSTFDQFVALDVAQDEEDISEFGSGRIAQMIPKFEVLYDLDREWLGFGFLHPELTTNPKYMIYNEFYIDKTNSWEVVTGVEITQLQTVLDIGYIGFLCQLIFYLYLYYIIRHFRMAKYYLTVLVIISLWGLGGFAGLNTELGVLFLALSLAAIVLDERTCKDCNQVNNATNVMLT